MKMRFFAALRMTILAAAVMNGSQQRASAQFATFDASNLALAVLLIGALVRFLVPQKESAPPDAQVTAASPAASAPSSPVTSKTLVERVFGPAPAAEPAPVRRSSGRWRRFFPASFSGGQAGSFRTVAGDERTHHSAGTGRL